MHMTVKETLKKDYDLLDRLINYLKIIFFQNPLKFLISP